jgi:hypothetical protein
MLDETTGSRMQSASLHEALRQALKAGDFDAARQLSDALGFAIVRELEAALPTAVPSLFGQRIALLEENLSLARVLRAHLASQLQINTAVVLYQPAASCASSWGFDA